MSDKKLAILAIIAVIISGLAVLQNRISQRSGTADYSRSALIAGLDLQAVAGIEIVSEQGTQSVRLNRSNGGFVVADKDGYPADVSKINKLIEQSLDIRTNEKITDDSKNHADLKVTPETARYTVRFLDAAGQDIVGFAASGNGQDDTFARLLSEDTVYSIQSPPWINTRSMDYIETELVTVAKDQIERVAVMTSSEDTYILSVDPNDQIFLENMPAGKQFAGSAEKSVFGALSSLRFEDVISAIMTPDESRSDKIDPEALAFDYTYSCRLKDKRVYKLALAKKDDKTYVKVSVDYLDKTPVEKTVGEVETEEQLKAKEAKLLTIDEVNLFNQKHDGWIYQIPSYKAGDLTKPLSELIEDIPTEEENVSVDSSDAASSD